MPAIIPVSLDVQTAEVLDTRTVGPSSGTSSIQFKAPGLLRYETDNDEWVYYNGSGWVPLVSPLPTRTNIPLTSDVMTKVLMEGHLNGGVGDTGALWQQLSLNHLSDMEFISALNMHRTSYGLIVRGNVQTEDANGVTNFTLTPTGDVICNDINCSDITCNRIGIGTSSPSEKLDVNGTAKATVLKINTTATPLTNDAIRFSHGRILSQSNQIMLQSFTTYLILKTDLLVYEANRHHYFYGQNVYFNNTGTTSDDRLKWDETPITNGLSIINQLQPQVYWKGKQLNVEPTEEERRRESGFIAQEVAQIPELAHTVSQSIDEERSGDTYYLDYTQLMAFQVAAIKELHAIIQSQNDRIAALESKITV